MLKPLKYRLRWSRHPLVRASFWGSRGASFLLAYICVRAMVDQLQFFTAGNLTTATFLDPYRLIWLANGVLVPAAAYVTFFVNCGRTIKQARITFFCCAMLTLPAVGYFTYSLSHTLPLPGGYLDMEMVLSAVFMLLLVALLWGGALLRYGMIRPLKDEDYHVRCGACGYDLTGNTSGVCPECGQRFLSSQCQSDELVGNRTQEETNRP